MRARSRNRYLGAVSKGKASSICRAVHSALGWAVTLKCTNRRRSCWITMKRRPFGNSERLRYLTMRESRAYGAREPEFGYYEMRGYPCGRLATRYDLFWRGRNGDTERTCSILPLPPSLDSPVRIRAASPRSASVRYVGLGRRFECCSTRRPV